MARVLVVDDEPMLLRSYQRMMRRSHDVVTREGGREALELLAGDRDFQVVLCDLMMPDIDGQGFYEGLERIAPELRTRVVFCTGSASTPGVQEFLASVPNPVIEKPTPVAQLLAAISDVAG